MLQLKTVNLSGSKAITDGGVIEIARALRACTSLTSLCLQGCARITDLGWLYLFLPLMAGNVICCFFAMLINNLAKDRQYPIFW